MKNNITKLSIIIPTYNEASTITQILEKIIQTELPERIGKEIWVIDDCSTDETAGKVKAFIRQHPETTIEYIKLEENHGKGYAVRTGIERATGEVIIIQDADLEYDPADYSSLLQPILSGEYQVVYGSRLLNKSNSISSHTFYWGGRFVSFVTSLLFSQKITDEPTCYKMFDANVLKSIPLVYDRFGFCPEVTAKLLMKGYKIKEVPISYYPRSIKEGKKIKWQDGIEAVYILMKYRFPSHSPATYARLFAKNIALLAIAVLVVHFSFSKHPTYRWVHNMLKNNTKQIKVYPNLSFDEKMTIKLGPSYQYLLHLKHGTPENAVIVYPSQECFRKEGSPFTHEIYNKVYATRFLYPRKLILEEEIEKNKYTRNITHIAIVNGCDYEKIHLPLDSTTKNTVFPVQLEIN